jgi:hypothetical protein
MAIYGPQPSSPGTLKLSTGPSLLGPAPEERVWDWGQFREIPSGKLLQMNNAQTTL